ncbi:hypothetical protein H0H93_016073 [Arthromyces matolae]|nr:hypothetical protein H0H93_016073 [Arthromyces matolae]
MATSTGLHPKWPILLDWLAIHGMDTSSLQLEARSSPGAGYGLYALKGCEAATVMFSVPASALLNKATLTPLYPHASRHLTAIQLMSLHLFFYKPKDLQPSSDPSFGPYITTLPGDFAFHPLVWLCTCSETAGHGLLSFLPANIALALDQVACRFLTDCKNITLNLSLRLFNLSSIPWTLRVVKKHFFGDGSMVSASGHY